MDGFEDTLRRVGQTVSRLLDPVVLGLYRLHAVVRQQLDGWGVPFKWQNWLIAVAWAVLVLMLLRTVSGWLRVLVLIVVLVVLARVYGVLPGV